LVESAVVTSTTGSASKNGVVCTYLLGGGACKIGSLWGSPLDGRCSH
jgi:hypothetical protein